MIIVGSEVKMGGAHQRSTEILLKEEVQVWKTQPGGRQTQNANRDILEISEEGRRAAGAGIEVRTKTGEPLWQLSEKERRIILILKKMLKVLTGKDFEIQLPEGFDEPITEPVGESKPPSASLGWGLSVDLQEIYYESEEMSFSAQGTVRTADGKEIDFRVGLKLEREYREEKRMTLQMGDPPMTDPLVVNLKSGDAGISGVNQAFDLNGDGFLEKLPYLTHGSGYLALDRNNNGTIDNGLELFGPATGNGFGELASFDEDQNGWIDEADPVFDQLKIWIKSADDEEESLLSLRKVGIGALLVEGFDVQFTYKDAKNQSLARNRATGLFLREDGTPGTIQQIDVKA